MGDARKNPASGPAETWTRLSWLWSQRIAPCGIALADVVRQYAVAIAHDIRDGVFAELPWLRP